MFRRQIKQTCRFSITEIVSQFDVPLDVIPQHYSPSPAGRGRGERLIELRRALAGLRLPYANVKTAIGEAEQGSPGGMRGPQVSHAIGG
jgi:hypothetical protein